MARYAKQLRLQEQKRVQEQQAMSGGDESMAAPTRSAAISSHGPPPPSERTTPISSTPEQQRAAFALRRIQALAAQWQGELKSQKEFNSHASAMPFMIRANGLGQTAAFYRRKGTNHVYFQLYQLLGDWLAEPQGPFAGQSDLLSAITHSDQDAYLAAQIEALMFLDWVKKLASAFLAREDDSNNGNATP